MRLYPESTGAINNGFLSNSLKLRFGTELAWNLCGAFLSISRKLSTSVLKTIADLFYSVPKRHFYQSFRTDYKFLISLTKIRGERIVLRKSERIKSLLNR